MDLVLTKLQRLICHKTQKYMGKGDKETGNDQVLPVFLKY